MNLSRCPCWPPCPALVRLAPRKFTYDSHCGMVCLGILLQGLHRYTGSAVRAVRAGKGNRQQKLNRRQYFFHLFLLVITWKPKKRVYPAFACCCHPLPNYFFPSALFFPCLSEDQVLYKHWFITNQLITLSVITATSGSYMAASSLALMSCALLPVRYSYGEMTFPFW